MNDDRLTDFADPAEAMAAAEMARTDVLAEAHKLEAAGYYAQASKLYERADALRQVSDDFVPPTSTSTMLDADEIRTLRAGLAQLSEFDTAYLDHKLARSLNRLIERGAA